MHLEDDKKPVELMDLDTARQTLDSYNFWSEDIEAHKANVVAIPETDRSRIGLERMEGVSYPILDRAGLKRQTGIAPQLMTEVEDNPELFAKVVSHCLSKRAGFMVRFSGSYRGVTTVCEPTGSYISPLDVFDIAAGEVGGMVSELSLDRRGLRIEFVGDYGEERKSDKADVVRAGLILRMNGKVSVGSYCYRLVCSNGLIRRFEQLKFTDELTLLKQEVRNICQAQHADSRQLTTDLLSLDGIPFEGNREQILLRLGRQVGLPRRFLGVVLEQLPELSSDATMYDAVNIVTQAARELKRPERIQRAAGRMTTVLAHGGHRCSHCGVNLPTE